VLSVNGTIKHVNLNKFGGGLKSRLLNDHGSLLCIYDEIFGHNKEPQHDYNSSNILQKLRPISQPASAAASLGRPQSQGQTNQLNLSRKQKERIYSSGNPLKMIK
jgi:hypothetical protein